MQRGASCRAIENAVDTCVRSIVACPDMTEEDMESCAAGVLPAWLGFEEVVEHFQHPKPGGRKRAVSKKNRTIDRAWDEFCKQERKEATKQQRAAMPEVHWYRREKR